jgi:hypothetical protein
MSTRINRLWITIIISVGKSVTKVSEKEMPGARFEGIALRHSVRQNTWSGFNFQKTSSITLWKLQKQIQRQQQQYPLSWWSPQLCDEWRQGPETSWWTSEANLDPCKSTRDYLKIAELEFSTRELIFVTTTKLCKWFGGRRKNRTEDNDDREQRTEKSSMKLIGRTVFLITK